MIARAGAPHGASAVCIQAVLATTAAGSTGHGSNRRSSSSSALRRMIDRRTPILQRNVACGPPHANSPNLAAGSAAGGPVRATARWRNRSGKWGCSRPHMCGLAERRMRRSGRGAACGASRERACALPSAGACARRISYTTTESAQVVRMISTEQGAWWETLFGTEPSRNRLAPVMPLLPTTIRSASRSSATSRIASAGSPWRG
jgi:hypothetical protein